ncbi:MAG: hypothetical protein DRP60_01905 [Spirochaetes bacterium]|nr:MAG: hypothetical protein DRP60_01905 [Spirochaetota bacterium]
MFSPYIIEQMFTNSLQLAARGWEIISSVPEGRTAARQVLLWLAETLELSSAGIEFHDEETTYSWTEQVDRIGPSLPNPGDAEYWKQPFPTGLSYWFLSGFQGSRKELSILLNLLAGQWLCINRVASFKHNSRQMPDKRPPESLINPSWIAVSRSARNIRSRLNELSFSTRPLLLIGENGSGKKYLASLIHRNGPNPSEPFSGPDTNGKSGTLYVPGWHLIAEKTRKKLIGDKRRLIAAAVPGKETESLLELWHKRNGDQRSIIKIPALREHSEDIPLLAGRFLELITRNSGLQVPALSTTAIEALEAYTWPGNIRELKETMAWAIEKYDGSCISIGDLPPGVRGAVSLPQTNAYPSRIAALEYEALKEELSRQKGFVSRTARSLGLSPRQVSWRIKKYGIDPREFKSQQQF